MSGIPKQLLASPVLISIPEKGSTGSGTLLHFFKKIIFTTAKHVLYDEDEKLRSNEIILSCFTSEGISDEAEMLRIDLQMVQRFSSKEADIAIVIIGNTFLKKDSPSFGIQYEKGVEILKEIFGNLVGANEEAIKKLEDVVISGEIYVLGFPTSIGITTSKQFDNTKPLLRKGIVSNVYKSAKTIVLDCAVYPGNSGGPVLQKINKNGRDGYFLIGIVSQLIPYEQKWMNSRDKLINVEYHNSGYSIAVSMDPIINLMNEKISSKIE